MGRLAGLKRFAGPIAMACWFVAWASFEELSGIKLGWFGPIGMFVSLIVGASIADKLNPPPPKPPQAVVTLVRPGPPYHWWNDPGCCVFIGASVIGTIGGAWHLIDPNEATKVATFFGFGIALLVVVKTLSQLAGNE